MDSVFETGASSTAPNAPVSPSRGYPIGGESPTGVGAWWFHMVTQELCHLAQLSGLSLDYTKVNQSAQAIQARFDAYNTQSRSWSAGQAGAILPAPWASSIALDFSKSNNFIISPTLQGATVLVNPTNVKPGQSGAIILQQDATGGRVCAYGSSFWFVSGTVPALSTIGNALDVLLYFALTSNAIMSVLLKDIKAAS